MLASSNIISFCVDMHLIDAKCNNTIITSLFHFASTFATQNVIKNQYEINYYIITKRAATELVVILVKIV